MNRTTAPRSAAGVSDQGVTSLADYTRTSEQAHALGFALHPTEIEGEPAFLVSRWGMSRVLPDLAAVDTFLDRTDPTAQAPAQTPAPNERGIR